ncbi:mannitol dehydrogenase family protein [Agromyces sp. NPDC056965]|uniref:mannitol dehydrogenase family protein n=1 Tax=Agromyces sp. NPDC056965 TaxID=3345983 RepID=UPI00363437B1
MDGAVTYRDATTGDAPTRIVHLGVGAFHRAHQAWYTHEANEWARGARDSAHGGRADRAPDRWAIAAFTGRRGDAAALLTRQRGVYALVSRARSGDTAQTITSIDRAIDGRDTAAWLAHAAAPSTAVISLTITEAGYLLDSRGRLDRANSEVAADLHALRASSGTAHAAPPLVTAAARLAAAFAERRRTGAGPMAVMSCDNLAENGEVTRRIVEAAARSIDPSLAAWIDANVSFVSSMVDRITPRTTPADVATARRLTGVADAATVVAEPFSDWVIAGEFPSSRPRWEAAGARIVDDLAPFEERKLRLLNGAHSLLAYHGLLRDFESVDEAFADDALRDLVEEYWNEASASCALPRDELDAAIAGTRERFANPRIRHRLAQIAEGGRHKLPQRIVPVLAAGLQRGEQPRAAASVIAAWQRSQLDATGETEPVATAELLAGIPDAGLASEISRLVDREFRILGRTGPIRAVS